MRRIVIIVIAVAGLALASLVGIRLNSQNPAPKAAGGPVVVEAEKVRAAELQDAITAVGSLRSTESVVLKSEIPDEGFDTIGGLVTDQLGRVPRRGERVNLNGIQFEVLRSDARQAHLFLVERLTPALAAHEPDDAR